MSFEKTAALRAVMMEKLAETNDYVNRRTFIQGIDKFASQLPLNDQASLRLVQAHVAAGHSLGDAVKVAYDHMAPEDRGLLAGELVKISGDAMKTEESGAGITMPVNQADNYFKKVMKGRGSSKKC